MINFKNIFKESLASNYFENELFNGIKKVKDGYINEPTENSLNFSYDGAIVELEAYGLTHEKAIDLVTEWDDEKRYL
jgi:uncharacterized heparinase superfamily protein